MHLIRLGAGCSLAILAATSILAAPADTTRTAIPDLTVTGSSPVWGTGPLPGSFLARHGDGNLGETLEHLPGVSAVRRAPSGTEPVIRGLGFERVGTRLGAVPLQGACPGRMDPPVTYLSGLAFTGVVVSRGASASAGPGTIAGTILADPDYDRGENAGYGFAPWVAAGYESARSGYHVAGGVAGGTRDTDLRVNFGHRQLDDYDAPDGRTVPASLTASSANLAVGWRPAPAQRLWTAATFVQEQDVAYPALPMDNRSTDFLVWNAGWRQEGTGRLSRLAISGGLSAVDHLMDNADKPNRGTVAAVTDADTRTWAARGRADLDLGAWAVRLGVAAAGVKKDAVRQRHMVATGATFYDHMWPDARQTNFGGFLGLDHAVAAGLRLELEGRIDVQGNEARAADDPGPGGLTIRELYVVTYGESAAVTDVTETLGQGAVRLQGPAGPATWHLRSGLAGRGAGVTERYQAFGPAPGGYAVGNPSLAVEKAWQNEIGLDLGGELLAVGVAVFYQRITDYVLPTVVDRRDVNGDGRDDVVKGYVNVDATLAGGEVAGEYWPVPRLRIPVQAAYVRGRNTTDDRDLPEMPAFGGRAEAWYRVHDGSRSSLFAGARFAANQDRIDPVFGENRTGGWTVWRVGLETTPVAGLTLRAAVENLLDKLYHDHLTREAVLPVGDLAAGDEVPAPGRSFHVTGKWMF